MKWKLKRIIKYYFNNKIKLKWRYKILMIIYNIKKISICEKKLIEKIINW